MCANRLTAKNFDLGKFLGDWNGIETNIVQAGDECYNTMDTIYLDRSSNQYMMKITCRDKTGRESVTLYKVSFIDVNDQSKLLLTYATDPRKTIEYYIFYIDEGYNYAIIGFAKGHFKIISRRPKIELCKLGELEQKASELGFNIRVIRREIGVVIPCGGTRRVSNISSK